MAIVEVGRFFEGVRAFQVAAGVVNKDPELQLFDANRVAFYTGMQLEELAEKLTAILKAPGLPDVPEGLWLLVEAMEQLGHRFKNGEFDEGVRTADREDLLDADVDLLVVSEGSILCSGADGDGARAEVNSKNLQKIVNGAVIRDPMSGKILKPEGWTPPTMAPFVCLADKE